MKALTREIIERIIVLADACYREPEPKDASARQRSPVARSVEEVTRALGSREREHAALRNLIRGLSGDARTELRALMWVGRGDRAARSWDGVVEDAREQSERDGADADASYIGGKVPLAKYLRDGISRLERAGKL